MYSGVPNLLLLQLLPSLRIVFASLKKLLLIEGPSTALNIFFSKSFISSSKSILFNYASLNFYNFLDHAVFKMDQKCSTGDKKLEPTGVNMHFMFLLWRYSRVLLFLCRRKLSNTRHTLSALSCTQAYNLWQNSLNDFEVVLSQLWLKQTPFQWLDIAPIIFKFGPLLDGKRKLNLSSLFMKTLWFLYHKLTLVSSA